MEVIARLSSPFASKFGIPRQAGLVPVESRIIFEPDYRVAEAVRGIEGFDYLWLLWQFSESVRQQWSPTVRPPRLGGNERMGVFATRSPFRPNPIGLSSVRLVSVTFDPRLGPVLTVSGADLMDGTPIYDIKPYLPYTDSHPDARSGFAPNAAARLLDVVWLCVPPAAMSSAVRDAIEGVLAHDPRPQFHHDAHRVYGMSYGPYEVKFRVEDSSAYIEAVVVQDPAGLR